MGYKEALEAAGATVLAFESFGDYQGSWFAKIVYEGKTFWVSGCYGSCSGCDAFQAEFDYTSRDECDEHRYDGTKTDCAGCAEAKKVYDAKLAEFGRGYLGRNDQTQEELVKELTQRVEDYDWDGEYSKALEFVKANA